MTFKVDIGIVGMSQRSSCLNPPLVFALEITMQPRGYEISSRLKQAVGISGYVTVGIR